MARLRLFRAKGGSEDYIFIEAGEAVSYCYTVRNVGDVSLTNHALVDSQLGTLTLPAITLAPSDTYSHLETVIITATTVSTATWTASGEGNETDGRAMATVRIIPPDGSAPNAPIPDDNPTGSTDTITITETGTLTELAVSMDIAHPSVGDLIVTLKHLESGQEVTLIERPASTTGRNH